MAEVAAKGNHTGAKFLQPNLLNALSIMKGQEPFIFPPELPKSPPTSFTRIHIRDLRQWEEILSRDLISHAESFQPHVMRGSISFAFSLAPLLTIGYAGPTTGLQVTSSTRYRYIF